MEISANDLDDENTAKTEIAELLSDVLFISTGKAKEMAERIAAIYEPVFADQYAEGFKKGQLTNQAAPEIVAASPVMVAPEIKVVIVGEGVEEVKPALATALPYVDPEEETAEEAINSVISARSNLPTTKVDDIFLVPLTATQVFALSLALERTPEDAEFTVMNLIVEDVERLLPETNFQWNSIAFYGDYDQVDKVYGYFHNR